MEFLRHDVRHALRRLRQHPGFTAVAVTIMGLGIGANTAIFSIVNAVLFKPQPFHEADRVVRVFTTERDGTTPGAVSHPEYLDYRDQTELFAGAVASEGAIISLVTASGAQAVFAEYVSADFFRVLGLEPSLGRAFVPDEETPGANVPVAMVSYAAWQREYGGDPSLIGTTIRLNGRPVTVVGVGPRHFSGSFTAFTSDYWIPFGSATAIDATKAMDMQRRTRRGLFLFARLLPGITVSQAEAGVKVLLRQLAAAYPQSYDGQSAVVFPSRDVRLHPIIDRALVPVAGLLMVVVALVLLVACSNLANLLLVRATARRKEIAVRLAMGAGRARLIRQLLTESTALGLIGGAVGVVVALGAARFIVSFNPPIPFPIALDLRLDGTVLGFTLALSLATGVIFGLVPALKASRPDLVATLKDETAVPRGGSRWWSVRNVLIVSQVAISMVLLVGAGLFVRGLAQAQQVDPGVRTEGTAYATIDASLSGRDAAAGRLFLETLTQRLESRAEIDAVALVDRLPLGLGVQTMDIFIDGYQLPAGQDEIEVDHTLVTPGYFDVLAVPILRGRNFRASDEAGTQPVAIVSAAMAERFWGTLDVVGRQLRRGRRGDGPIIEIVGVAQDTKVRTLGEEARPYLYLPFAQDDAFLASVLVNTTGDPGGLPELLRDEIAALNPNVPVFDAKTMTDHLGIVLFATTVGAVLLSAFGMLGVILASIGLYGTLAFSVVQRTREVGIRVALGAQGGQVVRLIVREGMAVVAVGAALGLVLAALAVQPLAGLLHGVPPTDPTTYLAVVVFLSGVALVASYLPARHAARVDPLLALRAE